MEMFQFQEVKTVYIVQYQVVDQVFLFQWLYFKETNQYCVGLTLEKRKHIN